MPAEPKLSLVLAVCLIAAGTHAAGVAQPCLAEALRSGQQPAKASQQDSQNAETTPDSEEQSSEEEELAPAAVELDVSGATPLIQELYHATRETKEKAILARLTQAKTLVEGADVKAVDPKGRTALHWAVFGSSYSTNPKVLVVYEEIADALIGRGVEINREETTPP